MSDLSELIELLSFKTKADKLHWRLDGDRRITTKQGESIVDIDELWAPGIKVTVRNINGVSLGSDIAAVGTAKYSALSDILVRARGHALGADQALDALKSRLLAL